MTGGFATRMRVVPQRQPPSHGSFQLSIAISFARLYGPFVAGPDDKRLYREFASDVSMTAAGLEA